jgi:hypothetical protein
MNMVKRETILTNFSKAIQSKAGHANPTLLKPIQYRGHEESFSQKVKDQSHFCERDWPEHGKVFREIVTNFNEGKESEYYYSSIYRSYRDQKDSGRLRYRHEK